MATSAAAYTWKRVYDNPEGETAAQAFMSRADQYRYYWHWYSNSVFEDPVLWQQYRSQYKLYRHTRSIYNPAQRLVRFYAGAVYPGVLATDASRLPAGVRQAIKFDEDTPADLLDAIGQFWGWSNWQAKKSVYVTYGAALGSVLCEVIDDAARGKVWGRVTWPGLVADLDLDGSDNVKRYALEYDAQDENGKPYKYRKEVDQAAFRYFRNDEPFDYGGGAVVQNPYGFVPAVWCKHTDLGGDHGAPAMCNLGKWDELNSLAAHLHDQLHKTMSAPVLISATGPIGSLLNQSKRAQTDELTVTDDEAMNILKGPEGATVSILPLDVGKTLEAMDRLISEIEADHPELSMYSQLRTMSNVTGPAADRLMGDVTSLVTEAQAAYDQQSTKLFQMAIAIGGWRANGGGWGPKLSPAQEKFKPFDLTSYARGELDLSILPRPLFPVSAIDQAQLWQAVGQATAAGVPVETALREVMGWTDKQMAGMASERAAAILVDQEDVIPEVGQ